MNIFMKHIVFASLKAVQAYLRIFMNFFEGGHGFRRTYILLSLFMSIF